MMSFIQGMPGKARRQAAIPLNGNSGETQSGWGFTPNLGAAQRPSFLPVFPLGFA
jgi:hypothetical protein